MNKYYDFYSHIPNANENIGYTVKNKIPFRKSQDAIAFVMDVWPELTPKNSPVIRDEEKAAQISKVTAYELIYLRWCLNKAIEAKRTERDELVKRLNELRDTINNPNVHTGIMERAQFEVMEAQLERLSGYLSGMCECWKIIHEREFELLKMSKEPYAPEWRF